MPELVKINSIVLQEIGCFDDINLAFGEGFNLICGDNGIGKTTILTAIVSCFIGQVYTSSIKRNVAAAQPGSIEARLRVDDSYRNLKAQVESFKPAERSPPFGFGDLTSAVLFLKASRSFEYLQIEAIQRDPDLNLNNNASIQQDLLNGVNATNIKNWLANRWLFKSYASTWPEN